MDERYLHGIAGRGNLDFIATDSEVQIASPSLAMTTLSAALATLSVVTIPLSGMTL